MEFAKVAPMPTAAADPHRILPIDPGKDDLYQWLKSLTLACAGAVVVILWPGGWRRAAMGRPVPITRAELSAAGLRREAARSHDADAARRLLAIALVLDGYDRASAAELCGMDRQTLHDWIIRYNAEGVSGLSDRRSPGRPARLTEAQLAELAAIVEKGPDPATDSVVRWRRVDLQRVIRERFGVELHERTVGKLLHKLDFVKMTVRPKHPKTDPAAQAVWEKKLRRSGQRRAA